MSNVLQVRNPRTGVVDYELQPSSNKQIAATAGALRERQPQWQALSLSERIEVLHEFARAITAQSSSVTEALAIDTGRHTLAGQELQGLIGSIDRWSAIAPSLLEHPQRPSPTLPHITLCQRPSPYPLVGVISPWNFPLLLSFVDAIPALLAGCSVMIKPSEVTPRFIAPVMQAIEQIEPLRAVLQFITGDGAAGAELINHVDVVVFTGSVATGRKVAAAAAERFIPAFLELGGKDAAILMHGADLERASDAILRASIAATGQACQSLERVYVQRESHDTFVQLLTAKAQAVSLTYPDPRQGIVGPLIFARQAEIIRAHLQDAIARGAIVQTGGAVEELGGGLWVRPTVLTQVTHAMQVMRDETFGPVIPVMAFDSQAEAIALANDSQYGLSGAVFAASEAIAIAIAEQLNTGGISINDAGLTTLIFDEPKSGFGDSGLGPSRMGPSGMLRFLRNKALYLNRGDVMGIEALREC